MNDFRREPPALTRQMVAAVERVLASGWFVLGKECETFERAWAAACATRYCVGVGNGMDAIEIALRALDIGPGDEVITTSMTAFATVLAIHRAGATPVLADVDPSTALLAVDSARRCFSERTRAVVLVHLYGQVRGMDAWRALCGETGVELIEDCAQAHLASSRGEVAGSFGIAGAFSFYPTKNLGAIGDAGAIVTNDAALAARAGCLRNYGQRDRYEHPELGLNSRLDEVQASLLLARLPWVPAFTARRRAIASEYRAELRNEAIGFLSPPEEEAAHVHHLFVVTCKQRERLRAHLQEHGVQTLIHYPLPVHRQKSCAGLKRDPAGLRHSERHAETCLSLPCHPQLSDDEVRHIIAVANTFRS
jgi:dTDP-4-amino-4,6-dideoxygalactose transaminase